MKTIRYAFWALVGICLILVGLGNRDFVTVRAMPEQLAGLFGISPDISMPLFMVIFAGVGAGLLIGFLWEWVREHRVRADNRVNARQVASLKQEVATLRANNAHPENGDDVLAILDGTSR